jgi:hypothetical protein
VNDFNNMMRDSTTDYWDFVIIRAGFGVDALAGHYSNHGALDGLEPFVHR